MAIIQHRKWHCKDDHRAWSWNESREDVIKDLEKFEHEAGKKKKEESKYSKEITHLEKKIAERSNKLDKNVSFSMLSCISFLFYFGVGVQGVCTL